MNTIIPQKHCARCKEEFPATTKYFNQDRSAKTGLTSCCKQCIKEKRALRYQYRKENPVINIPPELCCKRCQQIKSSTEFHNDPASKTGKGIYCKPCAYIVGNKSRQKPEVREKAKAYGRSYHHAHKERRNAYAKQWEKEHKEHVADYNKKKRQENPEIFRMRWQRWAKTENGYEHCRTRVRNRKARRKGAQGKYTHADIVQQRKRQHNKCYYCSETLVIYHIDHIVPLSRGGSNNPDNLVLTCPTCNLKKNNKLPHEWPEGGRLL